MLSSKERSFSSQGKSVKQFFGLLAALFLLVSIALGQSAKSSLRGRVVDTLGAIIIGATVVAVNENGIETVSQSNSNGEYAFSNLAAGKYKVRATAQGFTIYEKPEFEIISGKNTSLDISLEISLDVTQVTVADDAPLSTNPESTAGAVVIKGADIDALSDNKDELEAQLRALAGPGAGPNGGEIFVDGYSNTSLPPRDTIREIRINQNPFSSEYDRVGFGRIEILTKPGSDDFRGNVEFQFEDESFNSRNPFSANRAPFQVREFSSNVGGPIIKNRASFFLNFEIGSTGNNSLINALILDPSLNVTPFQRAVLTPSSDVEIGPRIDFKINDNNTLVGRYRYSRSSSDNSGLGGFDLPTRAYNTSSSDQTLQLTETSVINASVINETRFQYIRRRSEQDSSDASPTVRVLDAFTSGGANVGLAFSNQDRFEVQNYTSFPLGNHALKAGVRLRHVRLQDSSPNNFAGTFTFTSLDQYRNTLLNAAGAYPTQFTVAGGNPAAGVSQTDAGIFLQDDWRVNQKLTLSAGLRYEMQTNISSNFDFAPRFGFAYAPGADGKNRPKTVFRGGFGIFYDRFGEELTLQANRFNGINQQQFIVTDPTILDGVIFTQNGISNIPTIAQLTAFAQPQTTRFVSPDLQSPYTMQAAFSVDRQLPFNTTLSATYINAQTRRLLRSRNINAPVNGIRPNPAAGNIFQYESTGKFNQNQLLLNFRSNFFEGVSLFANYSLNKAESDTDGSGSFPANSYDLSGEYGRAALDVRHRFVIGGNLTAPFGVRLSPFITFRSGAPFNITTGVDSNGDTLFTERPSFATSLSEPGIIITRFGAFDPTPEAGEMIVPRNYGSGPEFFVVNLRAVKEFGFGKKGGSAVSSNQGGGGNRGGLNNPFSGGGGGQRGGGNEDSRFKIELSVQVRNLFNRTNEGTPIGNLRSPFFGNPVSLAGGSGFGGGGSSAAGNRRIEFGVEFSF